MINFSYNVRISLRQDFTPPPLPFGFGVSSGISAVPTSPIIAHDLTLDELNQRVVAPFEAGQEIELYGETTYRSAIERIEIRAVGMGTPVSPYLRRIMNQIESFERRGTDVTREFIKDHSEWGPKLGAPERPESIPVDLLFDRLVTHEHLRQATRSRFRSRNFTDAVEAAFKCIDNAVKEKSGVLDKDGQDLMYKVFNEQSPVLKLNGLSSTTDLNEQEGYKHLFAGGMKGIRNPRAHEHELKDDPSVALELLAFANHLMRKLESATKA